MNKIGFIELYEIAKSKINPRKLSPLIEAGRVSSTILTKNGNVYTGVCIDTACSLGMCAERNAIANMITNGESQIEKLVCCMEDGSVGIPCGACREYLMQLDKDSGKIEILIDIKTMEIKRLEEFLPMWWAKTYF